MTNQAIAEKQQTTARLIAGGRLRFGLEELVARYERNGTTPSLANLRTLLEVTNS